MKRRPNNLSLKDTVQYFLDKSILQENGCWYLSSISRSTRGYPTVNYGNYIPKLRSL